MDKELVGVLAVAWTIWKSVVHWVNVLSGIIEPVVKEYEKLAADNWIDKEDRKKLVMVVIQELQEKKIIKLSRLQKLVLPLAVNWIAGKLPNFEVTKYARSERKKKSV